MPKSKYAFCLLNAESIPFITNHFNISNSDVFCFDSIANQSVKNDCPKSIDISIEFTFQNGFISSGRINQLRSLLANYKLFEDNLKSYEKVFFSFENVFVRIFSIKNKSVKTIIVLDKLIHSERKTLRNLRKTWIGSQCEKIANNFYKAMRATMIGALLPGKHGTSKVIKYIVSDSYTAQTIKPRLLPQVKIEVINDLKFPDHWVSNDNKRSIIFICSAWKHHKKEQEHRHQLNDIIILSKIIKGEVIVKLHPRDCLTYYDELNDIKNIKIGYFAWKKILNHSNLYFSNLSTCLIELYNNNLIAYSLMISFDYNKYSESIIADKRVKVINSIEALKNLINESK